MLPCSASEGREGCAKALLRLVLHFSGPLSCLPRPSPTTSNLQTTTKEKSPTGSPPQPALRAGPVLPLHASSPHSSANKCLLKVAGYAAQLEQYQKAIDIYEQVGFARCRLPPPPLPATLHPQPFPGHPHQMLLPPVTSSWELAPELGVPCRKRRAGGRRLSKAETLNRGKPQGHVTLLGGGAGCGQKKSRQLAVGEGRALLPMLPHLPPLCPLNASFLCVWQ